MTIKETWEWWWRKPTNEQTVFPPVGEWVSYVVRMIVTGTVIVGLLALIVWLI
jgi:hypothetical protein